MRKFILNILTFLFLSVLFSVIIIFLPPSHWDAAVIVFAVLVFLNKKPAFIFVVALIAGLFFEMISNAGPGIQMAALFASLISVYLLRNHLLKLNRWAAFILNIACATIVYRISLTALSALLYDLSSGFFQTVYDFTDARMLAAALLWNILLSFLAILLYDAARKRFSRQFLISR